MSDQKIQTDIIEPLSRFLPDPDDVPRTVFRAVCVLAYATLAGLLSGHADLGFVVGLGAACGLGLHRAAIRRDWALRRKIPRR